MPADSWPLIVGYRHEVLHTGVLAHLLDDPATGPRVAAALTDQAVAGVDRYEVEQRLPGYRGKADLVAELKLVTGGPLKLAVETKTDSDATTKQLQATAAPPEQGVLLAIGVTGLALTSVDLRRKNLAGWEAVNPGRWAEILRAAGAGEDPVLERYVRTVERERDAHARAMDRALEGEIPRVDPDAPRESLRLQHVAWLAQVRGGLGDALGGLIGGWWVGTQIGGPILVLRSNLLDELAGVDRHVYLQISCSSRRLLGLRVGGGAGDSDHARRRLTPAAQACGLSPAARRGKTFNAATLDLTADSGPEAAARVLEVLGGLAAALR